MKEYRRVEVKGGRLRDSERLKSARRRARIKTSRRKETEKGSVMAGCAENILNYKKRRANK